MPVLVHANWRVHSAGSHRQHQVCALSMASATQGYVQLFGSGEFFWAEGFPNIKFNASNIGDLQVIGK